MNTLHLKYALEVYKTASISKAAENLYMNQPHLSKAIRELESSTGITIFNRTSKGVIPTKKGAEFLAEAKKILTSLDNLEAKYKDGGKGKSFDVAVFGSSYISKAAVEFIKKIKKETNVTDIDYRETNSSLAMKCVENSDADLAVIRYNKSCEKYVEGIFKEKELKSEEICEFDNAAIMSAKHPLAKRECISPEMLAEYTRIENEGVISAESEKKRSNLILVNSNSVKLELLGSIENLYTLSSPTGKRILESFGLIQKKIEARDNRLKDVLIYRKDYKLTANDNEFLKILKQCADEIVLNCVF